MKFKNSSPGAAMPLWTTKLLGRSYSSAELHAFVAQFLESPPIPEDLLHAMYESEGFGGRSLVENWREALKTATDEIAAAPSRSAQRQLTIRLILSRDHWGSLYRISRETRHVEAWRHLVSESARELPDEALNQSLFAKWLVSVCTSSCLVAMAHSLFAFDEQTEQQCELHALYLYTLRAVDVGVTDYILDLQDEGRDDEAEAVGLFKDYELNPVLNKELAASRWIEDQVAVGNFDLPAVAARIRELQGKRHALAESMAASKADPEAEVKLAWPEGSWLAKYAN